MTREETYLQLINDMGERMSALEKYAEEARKLLEMVRDHTDPTMNEHVFATKWYVGSRKCEVAVHDYAKAFLAKPIPAPVPAKDANPGVRVFTDGARMTWVYGRGFPELWKHGSYWHVAESGLKFTEKEFIELHDPEKAAWLAAHPAPGTEKQEPKQTVYGLVKCDSSEPLRMYLGSAGTFKVVPLEDGQ